MSEHDTRNKLMAPGASRSSSPMPVRKILQLKLRAIGAEEPWTVIDLPEPRLAFAGASEAAARYPRPPRSARLILYDDSSALYAQETTRGWLLRLYAMAAVLGDGFRGDTILDSWSEPGPVLCVLAGPGVIVARYQGENQHLRLEAPLW